MAGHETHDVNIALGDDVSNMLYHAAKLSWENRPDAVVEMHPSFSGWRALRPDLKPTDCYEGMGSDGIGTKVEIAERMKDHSTIAHDLFAMACDDAVVRGAEPIAINTVLDVNQLLDNDAMTEAAIKQMAKGYVEAAHQAGVVILNGETAELGERVGSEYDDFPFHINWCATVLWYARQDRVLTGHKVSSGDAVIGLHEQGFRSNGITDVRRAMAQEYGPNWQDEVVPELGDKTLGQLTLQPSQIYSKFVSRLFGGYKNEQLVDVHGVAHITGGGQPSKLGRMLEPTGLGVIINGPIEPPKAMTHVQKLRGFDDKTAYGKWHMGIGMALVVPEADASKVLEEADQANMSAARIGKIVDEPGIRILNCGAEQKEEWLTF